MAKDAATPKGEVAGEPASHVSGRGQRGGAEGVVLGCTELPLLVRPSDVSVRVLDTTAIHVAKAVELALSGEG